MIQTTIFQAIAEREAAFAAIERADPKGAWRDAAYAFVEKFANAHRGEEFSGEHIVDAYSDALLIEPNDARWWGPVIQKAARNGVIVDTGRTTIRRKGHCTRGAIVWFMAGTR